MSHSHETHAMQRRRTHPPVLAGTVAPTSALETDVTLSALTLEDGGDRFAVPQAHLEEIVRPTQQPLRERIEILEGRALFRLRGATLPITRLGTRLRGITPDAGALATDEYPQRLIVLRTAAGRFALAVDALLDTENLRVAPLPRRLKGMPFAIGAAVCDDGRIAVVLDPSSLAERVAPRDAATESATTRPEDSGPQVRMMLVRLRPGRCAAIPVDEVAHIARFTPRSLERRGDLELARDAQGVLPVFTLAGATAPRDDWRPETPERALPVLVHVHEGQRIGYLVEAVEDIVRVPRDGHESALLVRGVVHERRSLATLAARFAREAA